MEKELTYILGAGASYQSIPIVKTFPERFNEFTRVLGRMSEEGDFFDETKGPINNIKDASIELSKDFMSHQSFDTYF